MDENFKNELPEPVNESAEAVNGSAEAINGSAEAVNGSVEAVNESVEAVNDLAPEQTDLPSTAAGDQAAEESNKLPVAEVVSPESYFVAPPGIVTAPNISEDLQAIAAKGGAVGAVVLGVMAIAGSFITNWSIVNGLMGLALGLWGLTSRRRGLAWIGLILCLIGSVLAVASISDLVSDWWTIRNE